MAIQKIFAYNTGSLISGTTQVGDIAVSEANVEYSTNFGGLQWWGGPDETNGYVIAHTDPSGNHNGASGGTAYLGFWRSTGLTDSDFLILCNSIPPRIGDTPFTNTSDASVWLSSNGYWTSFISITPTPTGTLSLTPTPTATITETPTNTPTLTQTPTSTDLTNITTYTISGCTSLNEFVANLGPGALAPGDIFYFEFTGGTPSGCYRIVNKINAVPTDGTTPLYFYTSCALCVAAREVTPTPTLTQTPTNTPTNTETPTVTPTPTITPTNISCLTIATNAGGGLTGFDVSGQAVGLQILANPAVGTTYPIGSFITFQNGEVRTLVQIDDYGSQYDVFYSSPISSLTLFPITICYPSIPTSTPTPTATTTETSTPTPSVTNTQTPSVTPTFTPTPSTSPVPVTGYGYNLVVLPYQAPTSGNTIFPRFADGDISGTTNPNTFTTNGVYWNTIDNTSVDRTNYYSGMTGVSVTAYFTQNGNTAIYSGSTSAFTIEGPPGQESFNYNPGTRPNQLVLIQSASTNFVTGQTVYISYVVN